MSKPILTDRTKKTVVLPVSIKNGKIKLLDGSELPEINDTVNANLIIPEYAIKDKSRLKEYSQENEEFILKRGETLLVEVNPEHLSEKHSSYIQYTKDKYQCNFLACCIEVVLHDDLFIFLRGTKKPKLKRCHCLIPFLETNAISLNHAYTLISQEFEKQRISHSGNVFKDIYYLENKKWTPLESLRKRLETR